MSEDTNNSGTQPNGQSGKTARKRHSVTYRIVRALLLTVLALILLVIGLIGSIVLYLKPERLTPIATEYASKYLNADVTASRLELYFWSTFPTLHVEIDSLRIDSRALADLPDAKANLLPANASHLLSMDNMRGSIDIPSIGAGCINLHDVDINTIRLNLVCLDDSTANYLIFPQSETESDGVTAIPDIAINRFSIDGQSEISYFCLSDSIDASLKISTLLTQDHNKNIYNITVDAGASATYTDLLSIRDLQIALNGSAGWSPQSPYSLSVKDLTIGLDNVSAIADLNIDFSDKLIVNEGRITMTGQKLSDILQLIPESYMGELDRLVSDNLTIDLSANLTAPYHTDSGLMPSLDISLSTKGGVQYERIRLNRFECDVYASIYGNAPVKTTIDIKRVFAAGNAVNAEVSGTVSSLMSDPMIDLYFKGGADLDRLPQRLWEHIKFRASGLLTADTRLKMRISDLSASRYHRIKANGSANITRFHGATDNNSVEILTNRVELKFGSSSSINTPDAIVDSLLTASVSIDTAAVSVDDNMLFTGSHIVMGVGMKNIASTSDTTVINPIGARLTAKMLKMTSEFDSMTISMRGITASGALKRYEGHARRPQMMLEFNSRMLRFTDPDNRIGLISSKIDLDFHPRAKPKYTTRTLERMDSLRSVYPDLPEDSIKSLVRNINRQNRRKVTEIETDGHYNLDLELDPSISGWLRRLDAKCSISALGGRMMSSYFPLDTRVRRLSMHFSTDTIAIDTMRIKAGQSSFNISGGIGNLRRATTSSRAKIRANFNIDADTININEVAEAVFAAAAMQNAARMSEARHNLGLSDDMPDSIAEKIIRENTDTTAATALIVPSNISASLNLKASNVLYSDIWFQQLDGKIGVLDGAINLDRFAAYTPIGSIDLTALYSAPDMNNLSFAAGIGVRKLQLRRFLNMMPDLEKLMPLLHEVEGVVTAEMAMTTELDSLLDLKFHTLDAVMRLTGDSLVLIDNETFRTIGKWLMFKHKDKNMIDHMDVELQVKDNRLSLYPFVFDFDRYKLGISGSNDLDFNLNYHIAVLKSPIPFKFGVNIKGKPGHLKFSLGGAHFNEKTAFERRNIADTARVNLVNEIEKIFRFGVQSGHRNAHLQKLERPNEAEFEVADTLTHADSLFLIQQGVIPMPEGFDMTDTDDGIGQVTGGQPDDKSTKKKKSKRRGKDKESGRREDN